MEGGSGEEGRGRGCQICLVNLPVDCDHVLA